MEIRATCSPGEVRIAATDHDTLHDAAIWRPGLPDGLHDTHVVRVQTLAPALGGVFVLLENGQTGFMPTRETLVQGALIAARVTRSAQNGKGLRLRAIAVPADMPGTPTLLQRGPTPLDDLARRYPDAPIFVDAADMAARLSPALRPRLTRCLNAFDPTLEAAFDALGTPEATFGALSATITPTPALVAIDLDSAGSPDFGANVAAFPALAREIRLRNLSGTILIDPAGVKTRKRAALVPFLRDALATDPIHADVTGTTPSGLIELTRQRTRPPLHELLTSPHGHALAALRRIVRERRKERVLTGSIPLIRALETDTVARDAFAACTGHDLSLVLDPEAPFSSWKLT